MKDVMAERIQSMLEPAGPAAMIISNIWWVLFIMCALVFFVTMGLLVYGLFKRHAQPSEDSENRFIVTFGILLPAVILSAVLFYSVMKSLELAVPREGIPVEVTGYMWWWEVKYPEQKIVTANEIYIPVGKPVILKLHSADVIHSFWVPNLHGKMDQLPGHENTFWIQADREGVFRGQCAEYCGIQHALMAFVVVALPEDQFNQWLEQRAKPPPQPTSEVARRGQNLFFRYACQSCHTINGTEARGVGGPDLTFVGERMTLGAGTLSNNPETLKSWIFDPHQSKRGVLMPDSKSLSDDELQALVQYLGSLKGEPHE